MKKLLIIVLETDPFDSTTLATICAQATVAAAMEYEVELLLTGQCWVLARAQMAATVAVSDHGDQTLTDLFNEAHDAGVVIKVCPPPNSRWSDDFLDVVAETVGNTYVISEAMSDDTVSFTY